MRHVAETTGRDLEALYDNIAWPLYKLYGHAFDAFKTMVTDEGDAIFKKLEEEKGAAATALLSSEVGSGILVCGWGAGAAGGAGAGRRGGQGR